MKKMFCIVLAVLLVLVGCTKGNGVGDNQIIISPSSLFEGDAKKLQPHMDMITGCVKVKYKGNKESIRVKYEIWENGKIKEVEEGVSSFIENNEFDGTVSISLKEDINDENMLTMKLFITDDDGHIGIIKSIEGFDKKNSYGPEELQEDKVINDNQEITVWGLSTYQGAYITGGGDIVEEIERADWGLLIKIYLK